MNLFRRLSFWCALIAGTLASNAQQPLPHTLLWRISGKGLTGPSYLFGTMHLNDQRLFHFGDSVYQAIEKTEGMAMEVDPDQMSAFLVNKFIDQVESGKNLKELVDDGYIKRNGKALARKFGKPVDEINTHDIVKEKNKWMSDLFEKGEMTTFVDAYLYNIARRQGKWVGGVEDISDQAGLLDDLVDRSDIDDLLAGDPSSSSNSGGQKRGTERMVSLYLDQNLDSIEIFTNENSTVRQKDELLIKRNRKMARRIDSLTAVRTMFIAVGAAHLPGDSGVIRLLKDRGFTLTPVFSDKRIDSKDYTVKEVHLPWTQVADPDGNYRVEMPANPADVNMYGLIKMKFLLDIFNLSGYCTMAVMNSSGISNMDSLFEEFSYKMFNTRHMPSKDIVNDGIRGKEYIGTKDGANARVEVFVSKNMIYMALISALKKEALTSDDGNKFFNSFSITKKEEVLASTHLFTDSIMGVSLQSPAGLIRNDKLSQTTKSSKVSCFAGIDMSDNAYIMLMSNDMRAGFHLISDSVSYSEAYDRLKKQYGDFEKKEIDVQGHKGILLTGRNIKSPNLYIYAEVVVRNNRDIMLFTVCDKNALNNPRIKNVFESFRLIDQPRKEWGLYSAPDSSLVCWAPCPIRAFYSEENKLQWLSYDTITATTYHIVLDTLGKYTWYESDSIYWAKRINENIGSGRLLDQKDIMNGNLKGKELLLAKSMNGNTLNRIRLLVDGDKTYKLMIAGEKELLFNENANKFFNSFKLRNAPAPDYVTRSKAPLILRDIADKDSLTRVKAYRTLYRAPFKKADLPLLEEALFRDYLSPYDTVLDNSINFSLAEKVAELQDPSVPGYIKKQYPLLEKRRAGIRQSALGVLAKTHSRESYTLLSGLLDQLPPEEGLGWQCQSGLRDSLALTAGIFPSLLRLARDTSCSPFVADLALDLMDSGFVKPEAVFAAGNDFISAGRELLPALKASDKNGDGYVISLVKLLGRLGTPSAFQLLKEFCGAKDEDLIEESILQLAKHNHQVEPSACLQLASDKKFREDFYDELEKMNKTALFPAQYLTQAYFAESALYGDVNEDEDGEEAPPVMTFLKKTTASFNGKQYLFYLYKIVFTSDEGSTEYLGVAGGYDPAGQKLKPDKGLSGLYTGEYFDADKIQALFKAYLKKKNDKKKE